MFQRVYRVLLCDKVVDKFTKSDQSKMLSIAGSFSRTFVLELDKNVQLELIMILIQRVPLAETIMSVYYFSLSKVSKGISWVNRN